VTEKIVFDCGHPDLNDFFCNEAAEYQKCLLATTYRYMKGDEVVALFSVSNDHIPISNSEKRKHYPATKHLRSYPAVKIGRLGVSTAHQRKQIGTSIIQFLKIFFLVRNKTGCRYITVDAYNKPETLQFYQRNGFELLTNQDDNNKTRTMYCDLLPYHNTIQMNEELKSAIAAAIKNIY
jgi:GNAT superfamily N-acetyltransferase